MLLCLSKFKHIEFVYVADLLIYFHSSGQHFNNMPSRLRRHRRAPLISSS